MSAGRGACRGSSRRASSAGDIIDIILSEAPRCGGGVRRVVGGTHRHRRMTLTLASSEEAALAGRLGAALAGRLIARGVACDASREGVLARARGNDRASVVTARAGRNETFEYARIRRRRFCRRAFQRIGRLSNAPKYRSTNRRATGTSRFQKDDPADQNGRRARPPVRDRDDHRPRRTLLGDRGDPRARPPRPRHTSRRGSPRARTSACLLTACLRPDASRVGRHLARGSSRRGVVGYSKNSRRRASRATMDGWASRGGGAGVGNLARKPAKPSSSGRKLTIKPFKGASAPPPRDAPRDRSGSPPHSATPPARLARARSLPCSSARP